MMRNKELPTKGLVKLFLRVALASAFLSAVADRLGWWPAEVSVWGSWPAFLEYTQLLVPWCPAAMIPALGLLVTLAEVLFGLALVLGYRTALFATLSGALLLVFALSMTFTTGIKGAFDFSVYTAAAAAFALASMKERFVELDSFRGEMP